MVEISKNAYDDFVRSFFMELEAVTSKEYQSMVKSIEEDFWKYDRLTYRQSSNLVRLTKIARIRMPVLFIEKISLAQRIEVERRLRGRG
jgi:hypothetical protein